MGKEYYVLRNGKVVYRPGHYDLEGARAVAKLEGERHPKATILIVKEVESYQGASPLHCPHGDSWDYCPVCCH